MTKDPRIFLVHIVECIDAIAGYLPKGELRALAQGLVHDVRESGGQPLQARRP